MPQYLGVLKRLEHRPLQHLWEEWVLVWGIVAADEGVDSFGLREDVVGEGDVGWEREVRVGNWEGCGGVDRLVEWELDAFD